MNVDVNVTLDLSPAFARAISDLIQAYRPAAPTSPSVVRAAQEAPSVADAVAPAGPAAKATRPAPPAARWTEERKALLRREYQGSTDLRDLHARLNALPGDPIDLNRMRWWANSNGLASSARRVGAALQPPAVGPAQPEGQAVEAAVAAAPDPVPTPRPAPARNFPPVQQTDAGGAVMADDATIRRWAAERGLCNGGAALDMRRINDKRVDLGLPLFARVTLQYSGATMRPGSAGAGR